MLGNFTKDELDRAKQMLEGIKATKYALNAHKHLNDRFTFQDVRRHLMFEIDEFKHVAYSQDADKKLDELADMSNCIDLLVMSLLKEQCKVCGGKGRTTIWTTDKGMFVSMPCMHCKGTGKTK